MTLHHTILLTFIASLAVPASRLEAEHFDPGGMTSLKVRPIEERQAKPGDVSLAVWPTALIDTGQTRMALTYGCFAAVRALSSSLSSSSSSSKCLGGNRLRSEDENEDDDEDEATATTTAQRVPS